MRKRRHPGKTDRRRAPVRHPWHPPVMPVSPCDHRSNRKRSDRMSGRKAARQRRFFAVEKRVVKRGSRWHFRGALSPRDCFDRQIHDQAVRVRLPGEQPRFARIRVVPDLRNEKECYRHNDNFRAGNRPVERVVKVVEVPGVRPKVRHDVRVRNDEGRRPSHNRKGGNRVTPFRELRGE